MKILYLGPTRPEFIKKLKMNFDDEILCQENKITLDYIKLHAFDIIVSYGYRHIISKDIIEYMKNKIINLHISFLPWNRGADPNFWSFFNDTKKGVSIHLIDEGIDTGDIIVQKEVLFRDSITLRESYNILTHEIEELFYEYWPKIREGNITPFQQIIDEGSLHYSKDKEKYKFLLINGWDTNVSNLKEMRK